LFLSRGTAIILLILYVLYLCFELRTHKGLLYSETATVDEELWEEEETMRSWTAAVVLILTTIIVKICAEHLVHSIDSAAESYCISKVFIGFILLPIVGKLGEHSTAWFIAVQNNMDLVSSEK
jgi:Ca2+:H+ antiporter